MLKLFYYCSYVSKIFCTHCKLNLITFCYSFFSWHTKVELCRVLANVILLDPGYTSFCMTLTISPSVWTWRYVLLCGPGDTSFCATLTKRSSVWSFSVRSWRYDFSNIRQEFSKNESYIFPQELDTSDSYNSLSMRHYAKDFNFPLKDIWIYLISTGRLI